MRLSVQMLEAAKAGDWTGVATLRPEYEVVLRHDHPANETTRSALLGLQQLNQDLLDLAGHAREGIARELGWHCQKHRALNAYLVSSGVS